MTVDFDLARQLFEQALERPPAERAAFLDGACGQDRELRARVSALLASLDAAGEFLVAPAPSTAGSSEQPGGVIDRYKLLQRIGEGGFGTVWMAEQEEPVRRKVALKVIKLGMDTREVVARFEAERQALALMEHPNIAKVFDGGITPGGRPYFVMELIKGVPITEYCDQAELGMPQRLELFQQVCYAVQHAHQKGVIHRDLKPTNILVTLHDGSPVPKVIDFGVAKATSAELTQKTMFTEFRQMVGTPEYMAPEQAELSGLDVDTRADVYSLGVVLYQLLTGTKPFEVRALLDKGYHEMLRVIREDTPQRPSTRISTLGDQLAATASRRHATPASLSRLMHGDLDWIVMKALEKERGRRYATANELASDIGRHLQNEPVLARPPGAAYRLRKFLRRNRAAVTAGVLLAVVLVLGITGTTWGMVWALDEKQQADVAAGQARTAAAAEAVAKTRAETAMAAEKQARMRAETHLDFVLQVLGSSDPDGSGKQDQTVLAAMETAIADIDAGRFQHDPQVAADLENTIGLVFMHNGRLERAESLFRQALEVLQGLHPGGDDDDVAAAMGNLALATLQRGNAEEAEQLATRALAMRQRVLGDDDPKLAASFNTLATAMQALGRFDEAAQRYEQTLACFERLHPGDHVDVAKALNNLATMRQRQGRAADAESLYERALAMLRKLYPDGHPEVAKTLTNLTMLQEDEGRAPDAVARYEEALAMFRSFYLEPHPLVVMCLNTLAWTLSRSRRYEEAAARYREALDMARELHVGDHPMVAKNLAGLGWALKDSGRPVDAEPVLTEAIEMLQRLDGRDSPGMASFLKNVADLRASLDRAADATPLFLQVLAMQRRLHPGDQVDVATAMLDLAGNYRRLGRTGEARRGFDEAIAMLRHLSPDGSGIVARALWLSAKLHLDDGDAAAALPELEQAVALAEKLLPAGHPYIAEYRDTLATCRETMSKSLETGTRR